MCKQYNCAGRYCQLPCCPCSSRRSPDADDFYMDKVKGWPRPAPWHVCKLGEFRSNDEATELLLKVLQHEDVDVRAAAVIALGKHLREVDAMRTRKILQSLTTVLHESKVGWMSRPIFPVLEFLGPLSPGGEVQTGSPRTLALQHLVSHTGVDLGFDPAAWERHFHELDLEARQAERAMREPAKLKAGLFPPKGYKRQQTNERTTSTESSIHPPKESRRSDERKKARHQ